MAGLINIKQKEVNWLVPDPKMLPWSLITCMDLIIDFQKVKFWNSHIPEMGGLIDIEKGCELAIHEHNMIYRWPQWSARIYGTVIRMTSDVFI